QGSNPCARANKSAMFGRINNYFRETRDELVNKVSWPTWEELRESTWIVLVASLLFALVIWALDSVLGVSLTQFYKLFK
ncbi:MAG: preprotein translocase subunit SecE, partial [Bacteroidia bacterium]